MRRKTTPIGVINVIFGGEVSGGTSNNVRKAYAMQALSIEVGKKRVKEVSGSNMVLSFANHNAKHVKYPHDDALVILTRVGLYEVKRILIDTRSSADILFYDAFV